MPSPNDFKDLIVSPTGSRCEKLNKLFSLPQKFYDWFTSIYTESGAFTEDFKTKVCAVVATCSGGSSGGGNPGNPLMPTPSGVNATDGTYSNKVTVTWNTVTPATGAVTEYKIYRALSTINDPNDGSVILLATVAAPTITYDDTTAVEGTTYNYWVTATDGVNISAFGGPDNGSASAPTTTLSAISDLLASHGFYTSDDGVIHLQWTAPTGATKFDIYRHTANIFASATKIQSDLVPATALISFHLDTVYDNQDGVMVFQSNAPDPALKYYFWVVAKKDAPPAVSPESNVAQGWTRIDATEEGSVTDIQNLAFGNPPSNPYVVVGGSVRARMIIQGMGGGGAGGGQSFGGGGGGASPQAVLEFAVSPGDSITFEASPNVDDTGNAAAMTDGDPGSTVLVKNNGVTIATFVPGGAGLYDASGSGAGGAAGSVSGSAVAVGYSALAGKPGAGQAGGRGGAIFGFPRLAAAHYGGFGAFVSWEGDYNAGGGGGSYAEVGVVGAGDALGGKASIGFLGGICTFAS